VIVHLKQAPIFWEFVTLPICHKDYNLLDRTVEENRMVMHPKAGHPP